MVMKTIKLCPNEGSLSSLSKKIKVYYGNYELPGVYSIEITEATLEILLDKAVLLNSGNNNK